MSRRVCLRQEGRRRSRDTLLRTVTAGDGRSHRGITRWIKDQPDRPGFKAKTTSLTPSQGRDNTVNFYAPLPATRTPAGAPPLLRSIPSNALNFCAFSMAYMPGFSASTVPFIEADPSSEPSAPSAGEQSSGKTATLSPTAALLALPNLTDSEFVRLTLRETLTEDRHLCPPIAQPRRRSCQLHPTAQRGASWAGHGSPCRGHSRRFLRGPTTGGRGRQWRRQWRGNGGEDSSRRGVRRWTGRGVDMCA